MSSTTIRIRPKSHAALKEIARLTGQSLQDALEKAIEAERRRVYLEGLRGDYASLRADAAASADLDRETALWDRTTNDGLEGK